MKQYRLLRNNRESGPYTAAQLIETGLKAYDLLWEEGKSAAWRYPSEMEAFKAYAPVIEEQPFDRFYNRKTVTTPAPQPVTTSAKSETSIPKPAKPRIRIKADTRRIEPQVFATTPIAEKVTKPEQSPLPQNMQPHTVTPDRSPEWESMWLDWEQEKTAVTKAASKPETDDRPTIKYSQSLDAIKEQYAATVLNRKTAADFLIQYKHYLAVFIIAVTVLGSGIWLGIRWGNQQQAVSTVKEESNRTVEQQSETLANATVLIDDASTTESLQQVTSQHNPEVVNMPVADKQPATTGNKKQYAAARQQLQASTQKSSSVPITKPLNNTASQQQTSAVPPPVKQAITPANNTANGNEHAAEEDLMQRITRAEPSIGDYVVIRNSNQGYGATGVQYKVENVSNTSLELVMIDLQYLDAAGRFQQGQTVYVRNIGPGATTVIKAPDNATAAKVTCKISMITSEKDNLYLIAE